MAVILTSVKRPHDLFLRYIKETLGLGRLSCNTLEMCGKELGST
jgi:hypothetical protein